MYEWYPSAKLIGSQIAKRGSSPRPKMGISSAELEQKGIPCFAFAKRGNIVVSGIYPSYSPVVSLSV